MNIQAVILSGGSGTRLWPLSRELYPKQLLPLVGELTLLQQTVMRLDALQQSIAQNVQSSEVCTVLDPIVVCNEQHRFLIAEQLRQIKKPASNILLEPIGKNTAPALVLAALDSVAFYNDSKEDTILLVLPADHLIADEQAFHLAVSQAYLLVKQFSAFVTFGIVPDHAETGYGYIKMGEELAALQAQTNMAAPIPHRLNAFAEKPEAKTAQSYVDSGEYLWNSGMFMMSAKAWLDIVEQLQPEMLQACRQAYERGQKDLDFFRVDKPMFEACPADSIDYAVMEKLTTLRDANAGDHFAAVIPLQAGWSDVGAWSALWDVGQRDENDNVLCGDVLLHDVNNSYIHAGHRMVASVGIDNIVVVETADAVLVAKKERAQDVKAIVEQLKAQQRAERMVHRQVYRPWGSYEGVVDGERFQVKRIVVNPGASLSLQMHHHRAEHWIVVKGTAKVTRDGEEFLLSENESTYIPLGTVHRLQNPGTLPLEIIEVQSGAYLGEDDIVRYEDSYGRDK